MTDLVSADTEAMTRFVDRGHDYVTSLRGIAAEIARRRTAMVSAIGSVGPAASSASRIEELADEATISNGFVEVVSDTLIAFDSVRGPMATVAPATIDWALAEAEIQGDGSDGSIIEAGEAYTAVIRRIDAGDDLAMSNGELNDVHDDLQTLDAAELEQVMINLTGGQLERLFHNVHSTGFWSNDWDDRERTEFYDTLAPLSVDTKQRLGDYSPYLEAEAEAWLATAGNQSRTMALNDLMKTDGFRRHLNFNSRTAVLWQVSNYPEPVSTGNLSRLVDHDWFQNFAAEDIQRSAKMIAFLAQYGNGDRTLNDNTLDLFLDPEAPFSFDWDQDGTAYGSAGGDDFHFNRDYLSDGDGPVDGSNSRSVHMVTHTVAHEVNHLVNEDSVEESFEYFMGEYRAYYVGYLAQHGSPPSRAAVEARVLHFLTADSGAYRRIASALDDPEEGPKIVAFVEAIVGRPVTVEDVAAELTAGVSDPTIEAPVPLSVDGGPNSLDNSLPDAGP